MPIENNASLTPRKLVAWAGTRLEDMTKDQLIAALQECAAQLDFFYSPDAIRARALGRVEMIKRGEK